MSRIGYARRSSSDQDTSIQISRLRAAGCDIVRSDTGSGASVDGRDELQNIMTFIRSGDELCVLRLDRLGRSTRDVLNLIHDLHGKKASLTVLEPPFSTRDVAGTLLATVLGMVAELERQHIRERQRAGIDAAMKRGVYRGRKPSLPREQVRELAASGMGPTEISKRLGISRMSVYRVLETASGAETQHSR